MMKRYTELIETAQQKEKKQKTSYKKGLLFVTISIPVLIFSFVSSTFLFHNLQATLVEKAQQEQALQEQVQKDLSSAFRLTGQEREEYIPYKDQQDMCYDERLVYLEEYNKKRVQPKIKYYTTPEGEKVFMGYQSGKIAQNEIRTIPSGTFYGGNYRGGSSARQSSITTEALKNRVQESLQKKRAEREQREKAQEAEEEFFHSSASARLINEADDIQNRLKAQLRIEQRVPTVKLSYYQKQYPQNDIYRVLVLFDQDIQEFQQEDVRLQNGEIQEFKPLNEQAFALDIQHKDKAEPLVVFVPESVALNQFEIPNQKSNTIEIQENQKPSIRVKSL